VDNWKWVSVKGQFLASTNSLVEKKLQHWLKDGIIKNHGPLGGMATSQVWSWIFLVILVTCKWMIEYNAKWMKHNVTLA